MSNRQWLEELHKKHYDTLTRLARNRLRQSAASVSDAEDVVQEAFVLAHQKDLEEHEAPVQWLMKTVGNLCMRYAKRALRNAQKQQKVIQARMDSSPERSVYAVERQESETEELEALMAVAQVLTEEEWELLRLYSMEHVPIEEIARQKQTSPEALRVRICRIRKKFKKEYYGM